MDLYLSQYFRQYKSIGSKDRQEICKLLYKWIRWKNLIEYKCRGDLIEFLEEFDPMSCQKHKSTPPHIKSALPKPLYDRMVEAFGEKEAKELALILNEQAPTTIRVNPLKISREKFFQNWEKKYSMRLGAHAPYAIQIDKREALFSTEEFAKGWFEVQDEGSQQVADLVRVKPGDHVLDYCAGSGGKTLAFAHKMQGKGQIYLSDIRKNALIQAKKRLKRAGVQNGQTHLSTAPEMKKLKKRMDWVLVDAPCSGTGTFRRNPDMKWKYSEEMVQRLIGEQRTIFERALSYVKPGGWIIYATCSLLKQENQEQTAHFERTYPISKDTSPLHILPESGGRDGFYASVHQLTTI